MAPLPLPSDASSLASIANNDLSVSCAAAGSCAVAATTFDGNDEGVLDTLADGVWTAQDAPTPGGQSSPDVQLTSVSCSDASTCVAGGLVSVGGVEQGLFESLASGSWSAAQAPAPAGTLASTGIEVQGVACPSDGTCVAEGQSDVDGAVNGLLWNLTGGTWSVTPAPLPGDAAAGADPVLAPASCPATGVCVVVGTYLNGAGAREGVVDTDPFLAATSTAVAVESVSGGSAVYAATVSGTVEQPTGTVAFSSGLDALCTATIVSGGASCSGPIASGPTVMGSYSGDSVSAPSFGIASNPGAPTGMRITGGWIQSTKINTFFSKQLAVQVMGASGAGVPGVPVTFVLLRATGPSAVFWGSATTSTDAAGFAVSPYLSANNVVGSYNIVALAEGVSGECVFYLTNTKR